MVHFTRQSRLGVFGLVLAAAAMPLYLSPTRADTPPATQPVSTTRPAELAKLLGERVDSLKRASELAYQLYSRGLGDYPVLMQCDDLYTEARVEAADSPEARMAVLNDAKADADGREKMVKERFNNGFVNELDVTMVTSYRLKIAIRMLQEKSKQGGG